MIYFGFVVILLINLFAIRYLRNSKFILLLTNVLFLLIWVFNIKGPDILNYFSQYKNINRASFYNNGYQLLYNNIMYFFASKNFSFYAYRLIVSGIALLIIWRVFWKLEVNIYTVLTMYMLTQFFLDGIQIRNFLGLPFLIIALSFCMKKRERWRLYTALFVFFASLIHDSYGVYFILLLVPDIIDDGARLIKVHALTASVLCMIFFLGRGYISVVVNMISSVDSNRALSYSMNSTNYGPIIVIFLQVFAIFVSYYLYKCLQKNQLYFQNVYGETVFLSDMLMAKRIFWINIICLYLLPFSFIQLTFYRLIRNLLLINFGSFAIISKYDRRNLYVFFLGAVYVLIWQITEFYILNDIKTIVKPFFESNLLFVR